MKRHVGFVIATLVFLLSANGAFGAWSPGTTNGSGDGTGRAIGLPTSALASSTGSSSIHITWAAPSGSSVTPTQYVVRRTAPSTATVCTVIGTVFACDDTGLSGGTTYTYTVEARIGTNWTSGQTSGTSATTTFAGTFLVSVSGTKTAGTAFSPTLTATTNGVTTDTSYAGVKTITFSGPAASPSGTSPSYPATVTFVAGIGTPSITLYKAATATLSVTDGTLSGSTSVTVAAGAASQLAYSTSSSTCSSGSVVVGNGGSFTSRVSVNDAYLNPFTQASALTVNLTRSPVNGTLSPTSLTISIGASETSASFTFTLANGNPPDTTVTAASAGLTSAACIVKKN